jgi:hypothetical protein
VSTAPGTASAIRPDAFGYNGRPVERRQAMSDDSMSRRENRIGTISAALVHALTLALEDLARVCGTAELGWLDDLRDRVIRHVKGMKPEAMGLKEDAGSIQAAVAIVQVVFDNAKSQLRQGPI